MSKFEQWQNNINSIVLQTEHPFHSWLCTLQDGISTFEQYEQLRNAYQELMHYNSTHPDNALPQSEVDCLKHIWKVQRKFYFLQYFLQEASKWDETPIPNFLNKLEKGITSFEIFDELEIQWENEIMPFLNQFVSETSNLMKIELRKRFNSEKHLYFQTILKEEVMTNPKHPFYSLLTEIQMASTLNPVQFKQLETQEEELLTYLKTKTEQLQKPLFGILYTAHLKMKELRYYQDKVVKTKWEICVQDIEHHPHWVHCQQLLKALLEVEQQPTSDHLKGFKRTLEHKQPLLSKELNELDYEWITNEISKRIRVIETKITRSTDAALGELFKTVRLDKGLSLKELESKCGVSASYILRIESGERKRPSYAIVEKIAVGLDIPIEKAIQLLQGNESVETITTDLSQPTPIDLLKLVEQQPIRVGRLELSKGNQTSLQTLFKRMESLETSQALSESLSNINQLLEFSKQPNQLQVLNQMLHLIHQEAWNPEQITDMMALSQLAQQLKVQ